MEIVYSNNIKEIRKLVKRGYCPIECSLSGKSIIDELKMDHHEEWSYLEPVALRAYRDSWGARKDDPRFVSTGTADADACFAIASLAGIIPPKKYLSLAKTIAIKDTAINQNTLELPMGKYLLIWNEFTGRRRDLIGFMAGINFWPILLGFNKAKIEILSKVAQENKKRRDKQILDDLKNNGKKFSQIMVISDCENYGSTLWHQRIKNKPANSLLGWKNLIVISRRKKWNSGRITCPNNEVAEKIFGKGGLRNVFPLMSPTPWGGGSPRGIKLSSQDLKKSAKIVNEFINNKVGVI